MTKTIEHTEWGIKLPPQIVDDLTRREFLIGAGLIALAPACGSDEQGGDEASAETRTVRHSLGETEVPVSPQRIVSLANEIADSLIALGRTPVGSLTIYGAAAEEAEDVEIVGTGAEPNLEKIAALDPDLIVGFDWGAESNYEELSEIAPTVGFPSDTLDWKDWLRRTAETLGAEEEAGEILRDYRERTERIRAEVEGIQVSFVDPADGSLGIFGPPSSTGKVLEDAGLEVQPVPQSAEGYETPEGEDFFGSVSLEYIPRLTGEHIFVKTAGLEDTTFEELISDPLWQRLEAVREGRVHPVEGLDWTNHGPLGVNAMLDEIEAVLLEG